MSARLPLRLISAAIAALGLILGSVTDDTSVASPARIGPFFVLVADLHVHAYPGDGVLPPLEIAREARRRGLHAVAITNHNQNLASALMPREEPGSIPVMISAIEITTRQFHVTALGIQTAVDWRQSYEEIVRAVHSQGGVVIASHPTRRSWRGAQPDLLDGSEVAHPLTGWSLESKAEMDDFHARLRQVKPNAAPVGVSDFHVVAPIGSCRTHVFAESVSVRGVIDALRNGRTVAEDQHGILYGDSVLVQQVQTIRAPVPAKRSDATTHISALLGLLGLLGVIALR